MKTITSTIWIIAIALLAISSPINAQTDSVTDLVTSPPPTTKERLEKAKADQAAALATLTAALNQAAVDASVTTSQETFDAVDKGYTEMRRVQSVCDSIAASIKLQVKAIQKDDAYTDEQKAELETAANEMTEACKVAGDEAGIVANNLTKAPKALAKAKKVYKSYLNLQGEPAAKEKLKSLVEDYTKNLTVAPEPPAEKTAEETPAEEKAAE